MPLQTAGVLYPLNSTTVDTAAGIDIRLLSNAQAGATDSDQSVRIAVPTGGNNNQERTFDPDTGLATASANASSFQGEGWALRLAEDMTPTDDTNYNAALNAGTLVVNVRALLNAAGGTYLGGACTITFRASLWRYNISTNTGVLIAAGTANQTWDTSGLGAENNTRKNTAISINVPSTVEFLENEVLLLQIGLRGTTLVVPTVGTTNYDITLDVDDANTNIDFATDQYISQIGFINGTASGSSTAQAFGAPVKPAFGVASGTSVAQGFLEAEKETTGTASGSSSATGLFGAVKEVTGTAAGSSTANAGASIVKPTFGTVNIGSGVDPEPEIVNPDYVLTTKGQLHLKVADTEPYPLYQGL